MKFAVFAWMDEAATRNPDTTATVSAMSTKMPRYLPRLLRISRGMRFVSGDMAAYQVRSAARMRAVLASSAARRPSCRRSTRWAM